ncbi:methyltransferase [Amniculicola lignicola CBS 123094]|uniref:Methyltransferase n=1 Tax=Amniculicola lignicola CBS 123094 TaxID=1392246 RepID=A0A6A5WKP0_9PLEO|nr:methyltransferase [Amniculicola lignicola CBS 123094]
MRFLEPWDPSRGNPYIRISPDEGYDRMNFKWEDYKVHIHDARSMKDHFMLDTHGFAYYDDQISPELVGLLRQNEKDTVRELYYPQVENLVKRATGATRVIIFDHTQRKRRLELDNQSNDDGKEQPATMVHCDQSVKGAIRRLRLNIGPREDIETVLKSRVQMINVWRPLTEPVQDWPLATMDYQTAKETDMHPCDLLKGVSEERGQTATFTQAEDQKWYYLSNQKSNEVTMIKIWDTLDGASKFCAHAAFNHPSAPVDATPRESVEVRCLVIHEPADAWFSTCEQCTSGTHLPGE